jgi:hypothetical protein
MMRSIVLGLVTALTTALLIFVSAQAVPCVVTPEFYYPQALLGAALAAGAIAVGAGAARSAGFRTGLLLIGVGVVILTFVMVGTPYKSCGQFFRPVLLLGVPVVAGR